MNTRVTRRHVRPVVPRSRRPIFEQFESRTLLALIAHDDRVMAIEDAPRLILSAEVLANDVAPAPGVSFVRDEFTQPAHGRLSAEPDGWCYFPDANYYGLDHFSYRLSQTACYGDTPCAPSNRATVTINVRQVNDAPVATRDWYLVAPGDTLEVPASAGVLINDRDADGDRLTVQLVRGPAKGELTLNPDGSFVYVTPTGAARPEDTSFQYRVTDGTAALADTGSDYPASLGSIAHAYITVRSYSLDTKTQPDHYIALEATPLSVPASTGVLANDLNPSGLEIVGRLTSAPWGGEFTLNPDGSFQYLPKPGFSGLDQFTYTTNPDPWSSSPSSQLVTLLVGSANKPPPVAIDDSYAALQDMPLGIIGAGLLGNDRDPQGLPLTAHLQSGPAHGTVTVHDDGSFVYTPASGFVGQDSFSYVAKNVVLTSQPATVSLRVFANGSVSPPVARDDSWTVTGGHLFVSILNGDAGVLANDTGDHPGALSVSVISLPSHGTFSTTTDGALGYKALPGFYGKDSIVYVASDGLFTSTPATISLNVLKFNTPPLTNSDRIRVSSARFTLDAPGILANDTDPDEGDVLTAQLVTPPSHGELTLNSDGSFTYLPKPGFRGEDVFHYRSHDGTAAGSINTVTLNVTLEHAPPLEPAADSYATAQNTAVSGNVIGNDYDPQGLPLSANLVTAPTHGALNLDKYGTFTYTPQTGYVGTDSFTYRASNGHVVSSPTTVTIRVARKASNSAPAANPDHYYALVDRPMTIDPQGVLSNDTDAENNPLVAELVDLPEHGSISSDSSGSFTYTPAEHWSGVDRFTYRATDGLLTSAPADVILHVLRFDFPPLTNPDRITVSQSPFSLSAPGVLRNDVDPDSDPLQAVLVTPPSHGELTLSADGGFTYNPVAGFQGEDYFVYRANDATREGNPTTVTLNVSLTPTPPILSTAERPWHNASLPTDVSHDGFVAPNDVLEIINFINQHGSRPVATDAAVRSLYLDVDGDNVVAPRDALAVINSLDTRRNEPAEGESSSLLDMLALDGASHSKRRRRS